MVNGMGVTHLQRWLKKSNLAQGVANLTAISQARTIWHLEKSVPAGTSPEHILNIHNFRIN